MPGFALGAAGLIVLAAVVAWRLRAGFVQFRERFHGHLAACPDIEWRADTRNGLICAVSGLPLEVDLLETYIFHIRHREPDEAAYDRVVVGLRHRVPPVSPPPLPLVTDRILPLLKPEDDLRLLHGYRQQHRRVRTPFPAGLAVAYVIEGQFQVTVITDGMLSAWGLGMDELHRVALGNLRTKTQHLLDELGGPQTEYVALDGFEAARLLVSDLIVPPGIGDPMLAIPHEHACLIAPTADAAALAARAADMHAQGELPLTALLFMVSPDGPVPRPGGATGSSEGHHTK